MSLFRKILSSIVPPMISYFTGSSKEDPSTEGVKRKGVFLQNCSFTSAFLMGNKAEFSIYLPKQCVNDDGSINQGVKYPVLYLLHGVGDNHTRWELKGDVTKYIDKAWETGRLGDFITVMPNAYNSFYVNGLDFFDGAPGHRYELFFTRELKPYIEEHFPVMKGKNYTAIAGNSMGGYGALRFASLNPEKYCLCYSMSGATEGLNWSGMVDNVPSFQDIIRKDWEEKKGNIAWPEFVLECGRMDPICGHNNTTTHRELERMRFPHKYHRYAGSHGWGYWKGSLQRLLGCLEEYFPR